MKDIYLDNAASTKPNSKLIERVSVCMDKYYGNPSAMHKSGYQAKIFLDEQRERIAKVLGGVRFEEIIFTSGGTESDNLAILGTARANAGKGKHIIVSQIEHHAVLGPSHKLEKEGFEVTYLAVDKYGMVNVEDIKKALRNDTILVSIMYANNEIGTIQPISEIAKVIEDHNTKLKANSYHLPAGRHGLKTLFHTDACQAAGYLDLNIKKLGVDMLTLNGSKVYGPKGAGILYVKSGIKLEPLMYGGGQENSIRPGTENLAGIVGLADALEETDLNREKESARIKILSDKLTQGILKIPRTFLNGHPEKRLPNNVNITILDIEGEALLLHLDEKGVFVSTGSACTSRSLEPSHVILAMGLPYEAAHGSIRFTLGRDTTEEEIDYVLEVLPKIVEDLRKISPIRVNF